MDKALISRARFQVQVLDRSCTRLRSGPWRRCACRYMCNRVESTIRPLMQAREKMQTRISGKLGESLITTTHKWRADRTPTVGLEATITRLRALRSAD